MFSNEKCYALKVQGDSMIEAGINDGDWVIVEKKNKIPKSKVAVILIDNQDVTLKYYKLLNKNTVELIPANKKFNTMEYDISRISIQGIVAQGTIYPDVIESSSKDSKSDVIKSHHNVGGLPKKMKFKLVEPIKLLFKDEVRRIGKALTLLYMA